MNMVAPSRPALSLSFVHDFVCPWCYLGLRRTLLALHKRPDINAIFRFHPFLLNPDMPKSGMPRHDYIARKFGGNERAARIQGTIAEIGLQVGILFRFDAISRTPSTVNAHRLIKYAAQYIDVTALADAIFAAYFTHGYDIGDTAVLATLALAHGVPGAADFLAGQALGDLVHQDNLSAHRLGINGVPCVMIEGTHAIAGAQEPEVIERLLDAALCEAAYWQISPASSE